MNVVDPFAMLHEPRNYMTAVAVALQSNAAEYIRYQLVEHLADMEVNDDLETEFSRGYRMGLRVAFGLAGGTVEGSEQSWAEFLEGHRGQAG